MIWKALPSTTLGIAVLAATGSCPDVHRHAETVAPQAEPAVAETETAPAGPPTDPPLAAAPELRPAIERALAVLQADGDAWMEGSAPFQDGDGCVSCHQVPYGVWGLHEAARAGIVVDAAASEDLARRAAAFIDNTRTGRPMSWSPMMLALGPAGADGAASYAGYLLSTQRAPGFWEARGQFPAQRRELSETNAVATMFAMLALAPRAGEDEAVAAGVEAGWGWLLERGPGKSTEWLALRLVVAEMRGEDEQAHLLERLIAQQNEDGGWSWNPGEESNAMSTGEALWALDRVEAGAAGTEAASRGLDYLVTTQGDDGWWRVASELTSQDGEESKDYVYDYWGTAWATIGLSRWHEPMRPSMTAK